MDLTIYNYKESSKIPVTPMFQMCHVTRYYSFHDILFVLTLLDICWSQLSHIISQVTLLPWPGVSLYSMKKIHSTLPEEDSLLSPQDFQKECHFMAELFLYQLVLGQGTETSSPKCLGVSSLLFNQSENLTWKYEFLFSLLGTGESGTAGCILACLYLSSLKNGAQILHIGFLVLRYFICLT